MASVPARSAPVRKTRAAPPSAAERERDLEIARKSEAWSRSGRGAHLGAYHIEGAPTDKNMRVIFQAVGQGSRSAKSVLADRCNALAAKQFSLALAQFQLATRGMAWGQSEVATLPETRAHVGGPGSLAPSEPPAKLLARFLERRQRHSWAREIRGAFGGPILGDRVVLAMLRIVPEREAAEAIDEALAAAARCGSLPDARAALSLGADPLRPLPGLNLTAPTRAAPNLANLLGHVLSRQTDNHCSYAGRADEFCAKSDAGQALSAKIAIACAPAERLGELLALRHEGQKAPPDRDAMGLALWRGLLACSEDLEALGMDPLAQSCGGRRTLPTEDGRASGGASAARVDAMRAFLARAESRALLGELEEASASRAAPRSPRL